MPTVDISFAALPAHVRTARLIAVAVARRAKVAEESLDELRLAVGEACSRAVALHQQFARDRLVQMLLSDDDGGFSVEVVDVVDAGPPDETPAEALALAVGALPGDVLPAAVPAPRDDAGLGSPGTPLASPFAGSPLSGGGATDTVGAVDSLPEVLPPGFRLAVIAGLVEDVEVAAVVPTGTRVRMSWPAGPAAGESLAANG